MTDIQQSTAGTVNDDDPDSLLKAFDLDSIKLGLSPDHKITHVGELLPGKTA